MLCNSNFTFWGCVYFHLCMAAGEFAPYSRSLWVYNHSCLYLAYKINMWTKTMRCMKPLQKSLSPIRSVLLNLTWLEFCFCIMQLKKSCIPLIKSVTKTVYEPIICNSSKVTHWSSAQLLTFQDSLMIQSQSQIKRNEVTFDLKKRWIWRRWNLVLQASDETQSKQNHLPCFFKISPEVSGYEIFDSAAEERKSFPVAVKHRWSFSCLWQQPHEKKVPLHFQKFPQICLCLWFYILCILQWISLQHKTIWKQWSPRPHLNQLFFLWLFITEGLIY